MYSIILIILIITVLFFIYKLLVRETFTESFTSSQPIGAIYRSSDIIKNDFTGYISKAYPFIDIDQINKLLSTNGITKSMKDIISQNKYKISNPLQVFVNGFDIIIPFSYASYYYYSKINKNYFYNFVEVFTIILREILRFNQLNKQKEQETAPAPTTTTKNVTISVVYDTDRKYIYLVPSDYRNNNNFNPFKDKTIPIITNLSKLNLDDIKKAIKIDTRYIIDSFIDLNITNYKSKINPKNNISATSKEIESFKNVILNATNYKSIVNICNIYLATYCAALNSDTNSNSFQKLLSSYTYDKLFDFKSINNINLSPYLRNNRTAIELYSTYIDHFKSLINDPIDMINIYSENNYNGNLTSKFIGNALTVDDIKSISGSLDTLIIKPSEVTGGKISSLTYNTDTSRGYTYKIQAFYENNIVININSQTPVIQQNIDNNKLLYIKIWKIPAVSSTPSIVQPPPYPSSDEIILYNNINFTGIKKQFYIGNAQPSSKNDNGMTLVPAIIDNTNTRIGSLVYKPNPTNNYNYKIFAYYPNQIEDTYNIDIKLNPDVSNPNLIPLESITYNIPQQITINGVIKKFYGIKIWKDLVTLATAPTPIAPTPITPIASAPIAQLNPSPISIPEPAPAFASIPTPAPTTIRLPSYPAENILRVYQYSNFSGMTTDLNISTASAGTLTIPLSASKMIKSLLYKPNPTSDNYNYMVYAYYTSSIPNETTSALNPSISLPNLIPLNSITEDIKEKITLNNIDYNIDSLKIWKVSTSIPI